MDDAEALSLVLANKWDEWAPLLGAEREAVESKLIPLLRRLDSDDEADRKAACDEILHLFGEFDVISAQLKSALEDAHADRQKGTSDNPTYEQRERYQIVPVFYGTNRAPLKSVGSRINYGGSSGDLAVGIARVGIPDDHRIGKIEKPRYWKLQFWKKDASRYVEVLEVEQLPLADFKTKAIADLDRCSSREILLFVHGYNVGFGDALRRTAQIAFDLQFAGIATLFSWPSLGSTVLSWPSDWTKFKWAEGCLESSYRADERNVTAARAPFERFLKILREDLRADTVHIVAHSMGNRLVTETIASMMQAPPPSAARLRQLVLAAPDIDAETFKNLAKKFFAKAERVTLYVSSEDIALKLSKRLNKQPRAGDCGAGMVIVDAVDTVDATAVETSLLGHSYYGDNRSVMRDIFDVIRNGTPPQNRQLRGVSLYGKRYWMFRW